MPIFQAVKKSLRLINMGSSFTIFSAIYSEKSKEECKASYQNFKIRHRCLS